MKKLRIKKRVIALTLISLFLVNVSAQAQTSVTSVLDNLKAQMAPDKRVAIWDVKVVENKGVATLEGTVGYQEQRDAIEAELKNRKINFKDNIKVLANAIPQGKQWALVKLSIASLRCEPEHSGEMATQGIMGMPLKVIEKAGDWYRVQCPDNYIAYVPESSIAFMTKEAIDRWKQSNRYIVTVYDDRLVTEPGGDETVSDVVLGNILTATSVQDGWIKLETPDGRTGWIKDSSVEEFGQWAQQAVDMKKIERTAKRMMGSGYLWGGTSTKVTDCSGLVKVSYFSNGVILQRDASQQALTGKKIDKWQDAQLGDLLFFGNSKTGRVTHVGIYLRDGKYIHCSGRVKINDLDPSAPDYLYSPLSISRINGEIGTRGIVLVKNHDWYF